MEASSILDGLLKKKGGLKTLAYGENVKNKRSTYALVCETLKFKSVMDEIFQATNFYKATKLKRSTIIYVLVYDLLFGRGKIEGGGAMKKKLLEHSRVMSTALVRLKIRRKAKSNEELLPLDLRKPVALPRYARINTVKSSFNDVQEALDQDLRGLLTRDDCIPNLLQFPSGTELHNHDLVKNGALILQDKASCFPAYALFGKDPVLGDVIDACAAPGNKTSHLAMLLPPGCKVFAFDRSATRLNVLQKRMQLAGVDHLVDSHCMSFLDADPLDPRFSNVRNILLDPSCSGSGMSNRLDHLIDTISSRDDREVDGNCDPFSPDSDRLRSLADFQISALMKAMSFPLVKRIVYSTCSIYKEENECVVEAVLEQLKKDSDNHFRLKKCLPEWHRRGLPDVGLSTQDADAVVRVATEDNTNGFFVCVFERYTPKKKNKKKNKKKQRR